MTRRHRFFAGLAAASLVVATSLALFFFALVGASLALVALLTSGGMASYVVFRGGLPPGAQSVLIVPLFGLSLVIIGTFIVHWSPADITRVAFIGVYSVAVGVAAIYWVSNGRGLPRLRDTLPSRSVMSGGLITFGMAIAVVTIALGIARTPAPAPASAGFTILWLDAPGQEDLEIGVRSIDVKVRQFRLAVDADGRRIIERAFSLSPGATARLRLSTRSLGEADILEAKLYRTDREGVYRRVRLDRRLNG